MSWASPITLSLSFSIPARTRFVSCNLVSPKFMTFTVFLKQGSGFASAAGINQAESLTFARTSWAPYSFARLISAGRTGLYASLRMNSCGSLTSW
jgi:hypothetical protein